MGQPTPDAKERAEVTLKKQISDMNLNANDLNKRIWDLKEHLFGHTSTSGEGKAEPDPAGLFGGMTSSIIRTNGVLAECHEAMSLIEKELEVPTREASNR